VNSRQKQLQASFEKLMVKQGNSQNNRLCFWNNSKTTNYFLVNILFAGLFDESEFSSIKSIFKNNPNEK